jgi:hypothetical protein
MSTAGDYFVVFSNLASIPCIIYYQYYQKYFYSIQILLASLFSFIHHIKSTNLYVVYDSGLFDLLDGVYSYLTIYLFAIYLFLSNHNELKMELSFVQTIILCLTFTNIGTIIALPITIFLILFITSIHRQKINKISLYNKYLYITVLLCCADVTCFFIAMQTEYNSFHAIHHLLSFNIPFFVDKCVTETTQSTLET